jgi:hypothetical protein
VRRLPDATPPQAPQRHDAPPSAPQRNAAPPSAPRRNAASSSSRESTATGWTPNVRGYERSRLYSYFTAGLNYQQENSQ